MCDYSLHGIENRLAEEDEVLQDLEEGQRVKVLALSSEKPGVREEVHSRRRPVWHTGSPDMHDGGSFAIPEELGNFYSDGGPEIPRLIPRGFGR